MSTRFTALARLTCIAVILTLSTGCATTFRSEPESVPDRTEMLRFTTERYTTELYTKEGYNAANKDYFAISPLIIGTLTGMTLPFAAGGAVTVVSDEKGTAGGLGIAAGFGASALWIWGGKKLTNTLNIPDPGQYVTDYSDLEKQAFSNGYNKYIESMRSFAYGSGVVLGIGIDFGILFWMLSQIGPIGA